MESEYGKLTGREVIERYVHYYDERSRGIDETHIEDLLYSLSSNILCMQENLAPDDDPLTVIKKKMRNKILNEIARGFK